MSKITHTELPELGTEAPAYLRLAHSFNNACDDIVWIRPDKDSDDAGAYAIWSKCQWKRHTPQDLFRAMQRSAVKAFPKVTRLDPIVKQAMSILHAHMPATTEMDWNRSLDSIPFKDGDRSLCLHTGDVIDTVKSHRMLKRLSVHSDDIADEPAFQASRFRQFIESWLECPERRAFAQQALAQGLLGNPTSTVMDCWGTGRNGKGALFEYLKQAAGEYCTSLDTDYYSTGKSKHEWEKVRLKDARFAIIGEFEPGQAVDTGKLKSEAGGDPFSPSGKGKDGYEITAQCLFMIHGNAKLTMRDRSKGVQDRWKLLKFVKYFSDKERMGKSEMASIAKSERGAFMYWLIQGLKSFHANGRRYVGIGQVTKDTDEYFESENTVLQAIRRYCIPMAHGRYLMKDFYDATIPDDDVRWKSSKSMTKAFEEAGESITREVMGRYPTLLGYMSRKAALDKKLIADYKSDDILGEIDEDGEVHLYEAEPELADEAYDPEAPSPTAFAKRKSTSQPPKDATAGDVLESLGVKRTGDGRNSMCDHARNLASRR